MSLLHAFNDSCWAITPEKLRAICGVVERFSRGESFPASFAEQRSAPSPDARERMGRVTTGTIAVLPLFGVIAQRMNMLMEFSGGTSTELFTKQFRAVLGDDSIDAIVLNVDSPGGSVFGVQELSNEIYRARGRKPIVAIANSFAASAAYWIASAADEVVITPGGEVGSIGVLVLHTEFSEADKTAGITNTIIRAGKYKAEGNDVEPLADDAREYLQTQVNAYYAMFLKAVARNRGISVAAVRERYGEGRMMLAGPARAAGMVDRIATLDETLQRIAARKSARRSREQAEEQDRWMSQRLLDPKILTARAEREAKGG